MWTTAVSQDCWQTTVGAAVAATEDSFESDSGESSTTGCLDGREGQVSSTLAALRRVAVFTAAGGDCETAEEWRRLETDCPDATSPSNKSIN